MSLTIIDVDANNLGIYLNLCQGYESEFSAITQKLPDANGMFALDTVIDGDIKGFLLYETQTPIGIAAIKHAPQYGSEVCEFYVIPSRRKQRYGNWFAQNLFAKFAGPWQVKQIGGAELATQFWQRVIGEYTHGEFQEDIYEDAYWGRVTRQRFVFSNLDEALSLQLKSPPSTRS